MMLGKQENKQNLEKNCQRCHLWMVGAFFFFFFFFFLNSFLFFLLLLLLLLLLFFFFLVGALIGLRFLFEYCQITVISSWCYCVVFQEMMKKSGDDNDNLMSELQQQLQDKEKLLQVSPWS